MEPPASGGQIKTHRTDGLLNLVALGGIEPPTQVFSIPVQEQ